jgi:hypothetical protein
MCVAQATASWTRQNPASQHTCPVKTRGTKKEWLSLRSRSGNLHSATGGPAQRITIPLEARIADLVVHRIADLVILGTAARQIAARLKEVTPTVRGRPAAG